MVILRALRRVDELHCVVDALCRAVHTAKPQNVLLAQDRNVAFDRYAGAPASIGDDAVAENDALAGFEFDREGQAAILVAADNICGIGLSAG